MIIPTRFNIGDTFWVPRSLDHWVTEELTYEGEIWKRKVKEIRPSVKQKKIIGIVITINKGGTNIQYQTVNVENEDTLCQVHQEDVINNYTEEEAWAIAIEYANRKETYYGN